MSASSNGNSLPAPRAQRSGGSNRQSMHNGVNSREGSTLGAGQQTGGQPGGGVAAFSASVVPSSGQGQTGQTYQGGSNNPPQTTKPDIGRNTPQPPQQSSDEMSEDDVAQLIKDHKELRTSHNGTCCVT